MTVTAIIPSYGRPDSLRRCLEGLLAGERVPDQIVLVLRETDTASREAVAPLLAAASGRCRTDLVGVSEPGQIAALNAGLPHATGDIVTFPDDDCVPRPDWLRRLLRHYEDPAVGGVGGRDVVHVDGLPEPPLVGRVGVVTWYGRIIGNHHCEVAPEPRRVMHLKGVNMSFRRELLPAFDGRIRGPHFNDTDVSLGVSRRGRPLIYDPEAKVDHYPAVRPDTPGGRDLLDPHLAFLDAHDWMFLLLKHLPWWRRPLGALYVLLIGTRLRPGLLLGLAQPRCWRTMGAGLRGALSAFATARRGGGRPASA